MIAPVQFPEILRARIVPIEYHCVKNNNRKYHHASDHPAVTSSTCDTCNGSIRFVQLHDDNTNN
jgi:hypothetical protein